MARADDRVIEQPRSPDAPVIRRDDLQERLERLPRGHPSSPFRDDGTRKPPPPDYRPHELPLPDELGTPSDHTSRLPDQKRPVEHLTDGQYAEHVREVTEGLDQARADGLATDERYAIDPDLEIWSEEREAFHNEIINDLYQRASDVPNERQAIIAGGLPGAGKTTVLGNHAGIDRSRFLTIDPDEIKTEMVARKLVPSVEGLSPMEASDLVHEESSHIAKRLARHAQAEGKNIIWDITMSSRSSAEARIDSLRAAGYQKVEGIFVDIPLDTSVRRAEARHRSDHDKFRAGVGEGGRFIPPEVTLRQADPSWGSLNRRNFEELKDRLDAWSLYDNSVDGRTAMLLNTSEKGSRRE